ncbi:MAG: 3-hydroxyacyl-[acyl-carrier-protein] dehydratase FabZ [Candidatus Gerdarchaeota archaeon]|nr:MAG: 3-hydroxyacyl-[acyl-carrier-protein] dehydratase FabZ [Candidatus Gerdarchaeota archaeon]
MIDFQQTIKKEVELKGIGLHTGKPVNLRFKPSLANTGINFVRIDLPEKPIVKVEVSNLLEQEQSLRRTSIAISYLSSQGQRTAEIHTIEHLMAALFGLGIDNLLIEIDAEEIPGLDGSALPFFELLEEAGVVKQDIRRKFFQIREALFIQPPHLSSDVTLIVLPNPSFKISYTLDYPFSFPPQHLTINFSTDGAKNKKIFREELAAARTFCLKKEAKELKENGLGKGANYDNTLIIDNNKVVNNELRFSDEFVRHKILDLIGDFYLLGLSLKGYVIAIKSGHLANVELLKKIKKQEKRIKETGVPSSHYPYSFKTILDTRDIQEILPHRYPFLLVDKVLSLEQNKRIIGIKNVTINDYFFQGHFPNHPVMPGVLIIESLAQTAGILTLSKEENRGKIAYFMGIDKVKFRQRVVPGDQLKLEVEVMKLRKNAGLFYTKALVEGKIVAEANLLFAFGGK